MTVVVLGSFSGSPGVTALAMGLGGSIRDSVVVEADCSGGRLAARWSLPRDPGVLSLAAARGSSDHLEHVQSTPTGVAVMVGSESGEVATGVWRSSGAQLAQVLSRVEGTVLVDAGRLSIGSPVLAHFRAVGARLLVVARNEPAELAVAAGRLRSLGDVGETQLVLVGAGEHAVSEVESVLRVPVAVVVPEDHSAASAAGAGRAHRDLRGTPWARAVRTLAEVLVTQPASAERSEAGVA